MLTLLCLLAACTGGELDPVRPGVDADGDGWTAAEDCDDSDYHVNPAAEELCNGIDDDCDVLVDEDARDQTKWYADQDLDGWGAGPATWACEAPAWHAGQSGDCNDEDDQIHPEAPESCNGVDDDCDAVVDEEAVDAPTWYRDFDGDGYGDEALAACSCPEGYVELGGDCDDVQPTVNPGAQERCNGRDDDCSGSLHQAEQDPDLDGVPSCKAALWLDTDTELYGDPDDASSYGASQAAALLEDHDVAWEVTDLASRDLDDGLLDQAGLLVIHGQATLGSLSWAETNALGEWMEAGGSLLLVTGWSTTDTCQLVDAMPESLGLDCETLDSWTHEAGQLEVHPLTDGVSQVCAQGAEIWELTSPTQAVVHHGTQPLVVVTEVGEGRFVGLTDEWMLYNDDARDCDLGWGDHAVLVDNIWAWLLAWEL